MKFQWKDLRQEHPRYLAILAFLLPVYLLLVTLSLDKTRLFEWATGNADLLYFEEIAHSLNMGGSACLFDWRLPQATFLFPDTLFARVVDLFSPGIGTIPLLWPFFLGLLLCVSWTWVARRSGLLPSPERLCSFFSLCVLLYGVSIWACCLGDRLLMPIATIGLHSSVGLFLPVLAMLGHDLLHREKSAVTTFLFLSVLFLGMISDNLVLLVFAVPFLAYVTLLAIFRRESRGRAADALLLTLLGIFAAKMFSFANPFPQDREFLAFFLRRMPNLAPASISLLWNDLALFLSCRVTLAYLTFTALSFTLCVLYLVRHRKTRHDSPAWLAIFLTVLALPLVVFSQLLLGVYVGTGSGRQWTMLLFACCACGTMVLVDMVRRERVVQAAVITALLLNLAALGKVGLLKNGVTAPESRYAFLVRELDRQLPGPAVFVTDYWLARPIRLYSRGKYGAVPCQAPSAVFTNADNVRAIRALSPTHVICARSLREADFLARYGKPEHRFEIRYPDGTTEAVLDYSHNATFLSEQRAAALAAY